MGGELRVHIRGRRPGDKGHNSEVERHGRKELIHLRQEAPVFGVFLSFSLSSVNAPSFSFLRRVQFPFMTKR